MELFFHHYVVSVHESNTQYDGALNGHIRIAYGSAKPDQWELVTLAEGQEAAAAEDITLADINGDGFIDIVAACELAHIIYFENPTRKVRTTNLNRHIPSNTQNRGSFIRVFAADLDKDGQVEIIAANKGDQANDGSQPVDPGVKPISYFKISGNPLMDSAWIETKLIHLNLPVNAQPVDIDQDGDIDIIAGSRGERRIVLLENTTVDTISFATHPIIINGSSLPVTNNKQATTSYITGFNMEFLDFNKDGNLDIILAENFQFLVWLEQPADWSKSWQLHPVGTTKPDWIVGIQLADITGNGQLDIITGGYSRGPRDQDGAVTIKDALGRIAWFEQPTDPTQTWKRQEISRRKRGMFDQFVARDLDKDGDLDFITTRGNSIPYDGVIWLEQVRTATKQAIFLPARREDSEEVNVSKEN